MASGWLYNTSQSHVLQKFLPFRQRGWEPEPSAPDTDPESDCQCQLLVSCAVPLRLQLWKAQCAQSILVSLWQFFFTRIWVLISLVKCSFPPSEEADLKALRVPCTPSKPGEQYWLEYSSSISLSARLIWGSESFIAVDMGAGLMMHLNWNTLHVQLLYKRLEVQPSSLDNFVKLKEYSHSAAAVVMFFCLV